VIEYLILHRKIEDLTWEEPARDGVFLMLKESIRKHGQVFMPLVVDGDNRVWDGKKRAAALAELLSEGEPVSRSVPVIVVERDPDELAREINILRRTPSIEDLMSLKVSAPEGEGKSRVLGREDQLVSQLLRARGIAPRIFRELIRETMIFVSPLEEEDPEEIIREAKRFLKETEIFDAGE